MNLTEWNTELLDDVRLRGRQGQRLYLYVDRDLLAKLSGMPPQAAVDDFSRAFRASMSVDPFRRGARAAMTWRRSGFIGEPPFVAHLAMTVLAVTEEPIGASHGIYRCQNRLLGLPEMPAPPPGYGTDVHLLWSTWNSWLDGPGSVYGLKTAQMHPHWSLQGWARSQGLVRFSDRLQLDDYFAASAGRVSFDGLLTWLRLRRPDLWRRFQQEPALDILRDVFDEEAARWSREGPRVQIRPGRQGLLQYDNWTRSFGGAVPVDDAMLGWTVDLGDGEQRVVEESDSLLTVVPKVPDEALLRDGVEHRLADGVVMRFGGEVVYVMREDPLVNGLLQVRTWTRPDVADVLVRQDWLPRVRSALRAAGIDPSEHPSGMVDWMWLKGVELSPVQRPVLECLRLAHPAASDERRSVLQGGLRLWANTYLVGGEPDVLFEGDQPTQVKVDDVPVAVAPDTHRLSLADLVLTPGGHGVESTSGKLSFQSVEYVHETAVAGGISMAVERRRDAYAFGSATRSCAAQISLAGASLHGVEVTEPLVIRRNPLSEVLIITESGEVSEIHPGAPWWLRTLDLEPAAMDVLAAIRTTSSPVACLVVRNTRGGSTQAIAVPPSAQRMDGKAETQPRPDAIPSLVLTLNSWTWIGPPHARIRWILGQAMQTRNASRPRSSWSKQSPALTRSDVSDGPLVNNPFDDVLTWLSEREHGRASVQAFTATWEWACMRHGFSSLAARWRRALRILEALGHIERDYDTTQIGVTPATLVALPASSGLYVLTGSRPFRLLERLNDPDDRDPLVAGAASSWEVHVRTPMDRSGCPAGPQAVYVEWDPAYRVSVRIGLQRLGVGLTGLLADALLAMQPGIRQLDLVGERLTMSPGREMWLRRRAANGSFEWAPVSSDAAPGLYCYRLRHRKVFAWRAALGAELVQVEFAVGEWLGRVAVGKTSLVLADGGARRLLAVPTSVPLPKLLARSLVLRSGLPPRAASSRTDGSLYLIYENVDAHTMEHVAHVLAQNPVHTDITTKLA
ncbi:hypothetical protein OG799_22670 [Micromonospora sp. NBC_00898]|uniref:hypothetical protein n=1 Tax=Micromonospora sp. NBC_00898 TaxID=2975981 RepID=UPI0038650EF0|nr:hypothetical protein OG799_22670 [Micromonospora sp. NBC_00898]